MTSAEIKQAGIAALRAAGVEIRDNASATDIYFEMRKAGLCARATSNEYTHMIGRAVGAYQTQPNKAPTPLCQRPVYNPAPHPRLADIIRAQPPLKGMRGIGNGNETSGYGRGK